MANNKNDKTEEQTNIYFNQAYFTKESVFKNKTFEKDELYKSLTALNLTKSKNKEGD